jgi:hypothetical protein
MRPFVLRPGLALPLVISLAMAPAGAQPGQPRPAAGLPPAREVIDRYIREIGGREAILKQTSTHVRGTISISASGIVGTLEQFHARPNKFVQRLSLPGIGQEEQGFDGTVGWSISPLTGPSVLDGKQLEQLRFEADFYDELKAPERYASITTVEKTTFEERPVYKLRLVTKGGDEDIEFYDVETGLKAGAISTRESPMGPLVGTTSYAGYKQFGPLRQPSTTKLSMMSTQMVMTVLTLEYGTVDPAVFALPAPIKALLK